MSIDEPLDFLNSMNNENVHQILPGAIQPVIKRRSTLSKLQVQNVDLFKYPFRVIQRLSTSLSQSPQSVPLVADALAASIYTDAVVIFQGATTKNTVTPLKTQQNKLT